MFSVHAYMMLTMLLASSSFTVGAAITNEIDPVALMFIRFVVAALFFAPFIAVKHGISLPSIKALIRYTTLSLPLVAFFPIMFESLRHTSALNTGALYTVVPGTTAILAFLINREKTDRNRLLGLLLGVVGALWITLRGDLSSMLRFEFNRGDQMFLIGCLCISFYNPLVKRLYRNEPMEIMSFWTLVTGSFWLLIISGSELKEVEWSLLTPNLYIGVLYLAFFSTLCTFFLLQYCTVLIGPTKVSAYTFLTPLFVLLIEILLGKSVLDLAIVPGLVLVVVAMLVIQRERNSVPPDVKCNLQVGSNET